MNRLTLFCGLVLIFLSCHDEEARKNEWVEQTIVEKVEEYRIKKQRDCHRQLLERIEKDADSIMLSRARFDIPDSLIVPDKKIRPGGPQKQFPEFKKPKNPVDTSSKAKDTLIFIDK